MTFQDARLRLLAYVRNEVRNGELTERGFARLIGISQPHAHNVLKGARTLSPKVFDQVLKHLHLSLLDLAPIQEIESQLQRRRVGERVVEVAFLAAAIGPGRPWPDGVNWRVRFPAPLASGAVATAMVMAKLTPDQAMSATLGAFDIALLDISNQRRSALSPRALYVVERGQETVLRFIRSGARCSYLITDTDMDRPAAWEPLRMPEVRARVIWLGHERDRTPSLNEAVSWMPRSLRRRPAPAARSAPN